MLIEGNVIDARNSLEAFGGGAGINVAYQMVRVVIRGNHILFSPDHHYPWQAIGVQSGFAPHQWYGVGDISSYFQSGNYGLGTPALDVTINDNRLDNAGIRFFDVCHAGLGEFCNGLDSISPNVGSGLVERYVIQGNQITPPSCNRILGMRISEVFCEVDSPFDFVSRSEGANPWASSDNCLNTGAPALTSACNPNILKTRKNMACRVLGGSKCDSIF